ncbi:hypothetical protein [Acinetobacter sp. UBA1297]|nr:hypothetical protein [Acinetobacter sp. UBA1297]
MNNSLSNKKMHPRLHFLVELLSVRAGFYIKQSSRYQPKDQHRA